MIDIEKFVDENDIVSGMMSYWRIVAVLSRIQYLLKSNIKGDIVELGCNQGTLGMYIQKLLSAYGSDKTYHVYDSWQGLPEPTEPDMHEHDRKFKRGSCSTTVAKFVDTFTSRNLKVPVIHSGWFHEIPDDEYPNEICFAFFDGDFYQSIMDSFNKVYHKVVPNGIIMIDDCGWSILPGVKKACEDFLLDKPEELSLTGYPDSHGFYGLPNNGGQIIKQ